MTLFKNKYRIESTRLRNWDYAGAGWYFVTLCTRNREMFFGDVKGGEMILSGVGEIAFDYWQEIPKHSKGIVSLDMFVVMPNHIHGIVIIEKNDLALRRNVDEDRRRDVACNVSTDRSKISPKRGSLSAIIRSYKSAVSRWCGMNGKNYFDWQPRFYDEIIRDQPHLDYVRQYIQNNPLKWELDKDNPANLWM